MLQNPGHAHGCVGNVLDKRERQSDFLSQAGEQHLTHRHLFLLVRGC